MRFWPEKHKMGNPKDLAVFWGLCLFACILEMFCLYEKIPWQVILTIPIVFLMIMLLTIRKSKSQIIFEFKVGFITEYKAEDSIQNIKRRS